MQLTFQHHHPHSTVIPPCKHGGEVYLSAIIEQSLSPSIQSIKSWGHSGNKICYPCVHCKSSTVHHNSTCTWLLIRSSIWLYPQKCTSFIVSTGYMYMPANNHNPECSLTKHSCLVTQVHVIKQIGERKDASQANSRSAV